MTTNDWDQLAALAQAATPGPWFPNRAAAEAELKPRETAVLFDGYRDEDAQFIAAANPATILNLIGALAALRADVAQIIAESSDEPYQEPDHLDDLLGIDPNDLADRLAARAVEYMHQRNDLAAMVAAVEALLTEWTTGGNATNPFPDRVSIDVDAEVIAPIRAILDGTGR